MRGSCGAAAFWDWDQLFRAVHRLGAAVRWSRSGLFASGPIVIRQLAAARGFGGVIAFIAGNPVDAARGCGVVFVFVAPPRFSIWQQTQRRISLSNPNPSQAICFMCGTGQPVAAEKDA